MILSPYLFVIVTEYMNKGLDTLASNPNFNFHQKHRKLLHIGVLWIIMFCIKSIRNNNLVVK